MVQSSLFGSSSSGLGDFYDVYIIAKRQTINKELFKTALNATSQKRASLAALQDKEKIMAAIQADSTMMQRWRLYCQENYYAKDIEFNVSTPNRWGGSSTAAQTQRLSQHFGALTI